eukprot:CAMPEP_0185289480 /NCGR_PEP_ID=MMETSP1363-20130426/3934_1 /TAXON_ID=38817 /ORGANISM="Gephyrocapsa oceanica, Strain RCC1303" /LENGTH=400 /DNA_ID=CAMNT_0027885373 /DNA_START=102 /DNA_END=1305 /DNA_ORIENTATION=+
MASDSDPLARCLELKDSGNAALKAGDTAEAIRIYEEAASLAEAHPDKSVLAAVCSNLSAALLRAERAEEALVAAGRSVGARVDWSKAHFRRGEAAFALRQYKEAREAYRHAAELDAKEIKEAHGASAVPQRADKSLSAAVAVCDEAMKGGLWFRQLLPGRDVALVRAGASQPQKNLFLAAASMKNFVYLVGDAATRECYVVDGCWDVEGIVALARRQKMRLVGAVGTHYHFDHVGGKVPPRLVAMVCGPFAQEAQLQGWGSCLATTVGRVAEQCSLEPAEVRPLEHGAVLPLGPSAGEIEVLHTPGHSGGSVCLCVRRPGGAVASVLVGDTIFPGSCGRLDLPDSDVDAMFDSLQRLRALGDDVVIYPGHGYSGDRTTVGKEKVSGLLRPFSREQWRAMH